MDLAQGSLWLVAVLFMIVSAAIACNSVKDMVRGPDRDFPKNAIFFGLQVTLFVTWSITVAKIAFSI